MGEVLAVVAAIPNYNMGHHLRKLLPQVLKQGYDRIFVLDDASTDDSVDVVDQFGNDVTLVRSPRNRGSATTRNQIMEHVGDDEIIHFIDADMDLITSNTAAQARGLMTRYAAAGVGAIGGLVSRVDGSQEPYNYGPVFSLKTNLTSLPPLVDHVREKPRLARALEYLSRPVSADFPNVLRPPAPVPAFWLHEGNMLIHSGAYHAVGGYDVKLRNHEAQDLALRFQQKGIGRQFDPTIEVVHHYIDVRGKKRKKQELDSLLYLMRKHGYARWLTAGW